MRKFASIATLGLVSLVLAACGGSSGTSTIGNGTGTGPGPGTGTGTGTKTYSMGNGSGASFQTGAIGLSSSSLSAGGTSSLSLTIVDQTGTLYTGTAVTVTFNSPCVAQGLATITATGSSTAGTTAGTVTTSTGSVSATYTAKGCSGPDVITASAVVVSTSLTATGTVTVAAATVGSLQFVSATPTTIGLKGTGLAETSTVIFKVVDATGGARPGVSVAFSLNTTVGGMSISPATATSAADGTVQTVVSSGTVHTSVRVTATIASPALSTQSSVLTVTTGLPTSRSFSIAVGAPPYTTLACPNTETYGVDLINIPITVQLADRYGTKAPDGTAVAFNTNGGNLQGSCATPLATPGDGACKVTWTSANPRPQITDDNPPLKGAGRVTILATAIGEEWFKDVNASGFWQTGDPFDDLGEPFRDDNENGTYDLGERFMDFNQNGKRDVGDGTFKGITCTGITAGSTCSTSTLAIGASLLLVMSTSNAIITAPTGLNLQRSCPGTPPVCSATTGSITFNVQDLNGNPMAAGTTVGVVADAAIGAITPSTSGFTIGCSIQRGGQTFTSNLTTLTTAGSGNITITVTSPGTKSVTYITVPVTVN